MIVDPATQVLQHFIEVISKSVIQFSQLHDLQYIMCLTVTNQGKNDSLFQIDNQVNQGSQVTTGTEQNLY